MVRVSGVTERLNEPPWGRCVQGVDAARWVVVVVVVASQGGAFWTNRAEAHGQLVLSPIMFPISLRSSR